MKKRNQGRKETPSRVLLVCVYDTIVLNISNEIVYARFAPHGEILKILIFQRGEVTKFFIQFVEVSSAEKAKIDLDGAKLFQSLCKMNIYYSNFSKVDLKHETTEGVSLEQSLSCPGDYYQFTTPTSFSSLGFQAFPTDPYSAYFKPFIQNNPSPFQTDKMEDLYSGLMVYEEGSTLASPKDKNIQIEQNIESGIDWLLKSDEKVQRKTEKIEVSSSAQNKNGHYLTFPVKYDVSNRQIYNLFSNFGNISIIKQTNSAVFIKFRSIQFAAIAKNYLSGYSLLGNILNLSYIDDIKSAQPKEDQYAQITYYDPSFDRFTSSKSISINPPAPTLHVSSIRREACKSHILEEVFSQFGEIVGVQILSNGCEKNMALVQFQNMEDSFFAISEMHGSLLSGRKIQISFTKSRLF